MHLDYQIVLSTLSPANVDDRTPVPDLTQGIIGKLFGDRGYIFQELFEQLWQRGLQLLTKIKKNMKNRLMPLIDKILLRQRAIIESVNDQLKNISQIEHSRHRSPLNFMVNLVAGLVAYTHHAPSLACNRKGAYRVRSYLLTCRPHVSIRDEIEQKLPYFARRAFEGMTWHFAIFAGRDRPTIFAVDAFHDSVREG